MTDSCHLENQKLQYFTMMQNRAFKRIGRPSSWIVKIKFFTGDALDGHVLHHCANFSHFATIHYMIALNMA